MLYIFHSCVGTLCPHVHVLQMKGHIIKSSDDRLTTADRHETQFLGDLSTTTYYPLGR
jgi:hypothetical protein